MSRQKTIDAEIAKARLTELQANVQRRREALAKHIDHREEPLSADFSEQAVELENEEVMVAIAEQLDIEIFAIKAAIQRLENGSYGACVDCGTEISVARLEAIPEASECTRCSLGDFLPQSTTHTWETDNSIDAIQDVMQEA